MTKKRRNDCHYNPEIQNVRHLIEAFWTVLSEMGISGWLLNRAMS